jgi:hypothetical protein
MSRSSHQGNYQRPIQEANQRLLNPADREKRVADPYRQPILFD